MPLGCIIHDMDPFSVDWLFSLKAAWRFHTSTKTVKKSKTEGDAAFLPLITIPTQITLYVYWLGGHSGCFVLNENGLNVFSGLQPLTPIVLSPLDLARGVAAPSAHWRHGGPWQKKGIGPPALWHKRHLTGCSPSCLDGGTLHNAICKGRARTLVRIDARVKAASLYSLVSWMQNLIKNNPTWTAAT